MLHRLLRTLRASTSSFKSSVYMDYAAATPVYREAREAMRSAEECFGNPGSLHSDGTAAKMIYENARKDIAQVLAVKPQSITVVSSATEANNLAILGTVRAYKQKQHLKHGVADRPRPHCITTAIEHSSVLEVFKSADMQDATDVTILDTDSSGRISPETLRNALRPETILVSLGWANGEVGTIQHMRALTHVVRDYEMSNNFKNTRHTKIIVHTDAGQAMFAHSPQPQGIDVDMMTLSSGKLYGPRGVAVLYKPLDIPLAPIMYGGHQEGGLRPGTEDIVPLVGFAKALQLLDAERSAEFMRLTALKSLFLQLLHEHIPTAVHNGTGKDSLPHIVNISIPDIDSEYVMLALDHAGVSISTKSVCIEATGEPVSHVVQALVAHDPSQQWRASTTLRFSFGKYTTERDVRYAAAVLADIVRKHVKTT